MTDSNYNILLNNIDMLMRNANINQATLIRETGISQPQMSKALNHAHKNQFTFEQIWKIADYFKVSIDFLVGRKPEKSDTQPLSNKDICKILMQLIESEVINCAELPIEESMYLKINYPTDGYPYGYQKGENTYCMFYFSNYLNPDTTGWAEEQIDDLGYDFSIGGNEVKKSVEINEFLAYYFKLYDVYKRNDLPREIFDQAISDRLDKLTK